MTPTSPTVSEATETKLRRSKSKAAESGKRSQLAVESPTTPTTSENDRVKALKKKKSKKERRLSSDSSSSAVISDTEMSDDGRERSKDSLVRSFSELSQHSTTEASSSDRKDCATSFQALMTKASSSDSLANQESPRPRRRLSKTLSTDFSDTPKETGTIRVISDSHLASTMVYNTIMVSSRDKVKDVVKIVLEKTGVDRESWKFFDLMLYFGTTGKGRVLLSTEHPLLVKKELTTASGEEPLFEIKDQRVLSSVLFFFPPAPLSCGR